MSIKYSVIIPAYNDAPFLKELVESIKKQIHNSLEIIIAHSSTHDPSQLLDNKSSHIHVIHSDDRWLPGAARNAGAKKATGDWLIFIDSDVINSLCDELDEIRIKRNIVAHNPIVSTKPDHTGEEQILVIRHKPSEVVIPDKITKDDISELVNKTKNLMLKLSNLIPESKET